MTDTRTFGDLVMRVEEIENISIEFRYADTHSLPDGKFIWREGKTIDVFGASNLMVPILHGYLDSLDHADVADPEPGFLFPCKYKGKEYCLMLQQPADPAEMPEVVVVGKNVNPGSPEGETDAFVKIRASMLIEAANQKWNKMKEGTASNIDENGRWTGGSSKQVSLKERYSSRVDDRPQG